jgi:hypothetical protein
MFFLIAAGKLFAPMLTISRKMHIHNFFMWFFVNLQRREIHSVMYKARQINMCGYTILLSMKP